MSLRKKILALVVFFSVVILAVFAFIATSSFVQDKTSYVFDTGVTLSRALSERINSSFDALVEIHRVHLNYFDLSGSKFGERKGGAVSDVCTLAMNGRTGRLISQTSACAGLSDPEQIKELGGLLSRVSEGRAADVPVRDFIWLKDQPYMAFAEGLPRATSEAMVFVSLQSTRQMAEIFARKSLYQHLLAGDNGRIVFGPNDLKGRDIAKAFSPEFVDEVNKISLSQGSLEADLAAGEGGKPERLLVSFATLSAPRALVLSVANRSIVYRASLPLLIKTVFGFFLLCSLAVLVAIWVSRTMTKSVLELRNAMKSFGDGQLAVVANATSNDEIGELAVYFNNMTERIRRVMSESVERTRMEAEMATAQRVQATLFPPPNRQTGPFGFAGFYEPASECGGDWWYFFERDGRLYFCIGDVTGHGVSSALVTSACRATLAHLQDQPDLSPSKILSWMNRAVYAAARGELQMTFFAGALDGESGILRYANASHEAVIVAPRPDPSRKSGPRELRHLIEARGPRLGEGLEATFPEAEVQVERGQSLFVYSDGVQDVRDLKDAPWPERVFLKAVADAANDSSSAEGFLKVFNKRLEEHRQNVPLKDDLSYFVVSYGGVSSKDTRNPSV